MPINFDSALGLHADALRIRTQRAELLATNLANANTPHYKAQDIDFKSVLKAAHSDQSAERMHTTQQNHFQNTDVNAHSMAAAVQYRASIQDSLDGNTVDEQIEQSQFMENAVQYQASLEFLGGKFQSLTKAIKGE